MAQISQIAEQVRVSHGDTLTSALDWPDSGLNAYRGAVAISAKFQNCKNAEVMPEMTASPALEQQNLIIWRKMLK